MLNYCSGQCNNCNLFYILGSKDVFPEFCPFEGQFSLSYENDLTGEKETYITTIEGNKLVTKLVINGKVTDIVMTTREFTDSGFVQTYYGKTGVTGTRTFEKA